MSFKSAQKAVVLVAFAIVMSSPAQAQDLSPIKTCWNLLKRL
jgi:hypothetical protein